MGISLKDLPEVGQLTPARRRDLARWLRTLVPKNSPVPVARVSEGLALSGYAPHATVERLLAVGWLEQANGLVHADTYARRIAAGAVDGERMSLEQAAALADLVRLRAQTWSEQASSDLRLLRVVLYGSAVRDVGNLHSDIGDLDLALDIEVTGELLAAVSGLEPAQRWRAAVERSGLAQQLMQGDDRITLAGSLSNVLALFNRQLHGLDIPVDGRRPCAIVLWTRPGVGLPALRGVPTLFEETAPMNELQPCPEELLQTLTSLQAHTYIEQSRARTLGRPVG